MYNVHCKDKKKETKRLIMLLQSRYMFQFYVLQAKESSNLLQAHVCMDISVRKIKRRETLEWLCRSPLSVTLFKPLHYGLARYSVKLGLSDS